MPARNSVKQYNENAYYHIYNRGVEKRTIFQDKQDYRVFLNYLKQYLLPKNEKELRERLGSFDISYKERDKILKLLRLNNFHGEITLLAYCLMPNHFHFFIIVRLHLIKQKSANSIDRFMQSLSTRYTGYFNRKYDRVGSLFQAVYKAALVESEQHFLYLSSYIHRQSLVLQGLTWEAKQPSSYGEYLGLSKSDWVSTEEILAYFSKTKLQLSYKLFVEEDPDETRIQDITLED